MVWKDKYVKTHRSHGPFMIFQYCICSLGKVEMTSNCWYFELAGIIVRRKVKPCQLVPAHLVHQLFFLGLRTFPNLNIMISFLPGCNLQYLQHISRIWGLGLIIGFMSSNVYCLPSFMNVNQISEERKRNILNLAFKDVVHAACSIDQRLKNLLLKKVYDTCLYVQQVYTCVLFR